MNRKLFVVASVFGIFWILQSNAFAGDVSVRVGGYGGSGISIGQHGLHIYSGGYGPYYKGYRHFPRARGFYRPFIPPRRYLYVDPYYGPPPRKWYRHGKRSSGYWGKGHRHHRRHRH